MRAPVGAPAVQQLRGAAYDRQWAVFYSLSPYTAAAREFADSAEVALFAYDLAGNITAVNGPAKSLAATANGDVVARPEIFELHREVQESVQTMIDREPVVMHRILEYAARARQEGGHWAVVAQQVIDILSENSGRLQHLLVSSNGTVDSDFVENLKAIILSNRKAANPFRSTWIESPSWQGELRRYALVEDAHREWRRSDGRVITPVLAGASWC